MKMDFLLTYLNHFMAISECFTTAQYYWAEFGSIPFKILKVVCS